MAPTARSSDFISQQAQLARRVRALEVGAHGVVTSAGGSGVTWRGQWSSTNSYAINDLVYSQGSTWRALVAVAAGGTQPVEGTTWAYVAQKGATGATGAAGSDGTGGGGTSTDTEAAVEALTRPIGPDDIALAENAAPSLDGGADISTPQALLDVVAGVVYLKGRVQSLDGTIGTLTDIFRPSSAVAVRVAAGADAATVSIDSASGVITTDAAASDDVSLDGISFFGREDTRAGLSRGPLDPPPNWDTAGPMYLYTVRHAFGYVGPVYRWVGDIEREVTIGETSAHDPTGSVNLYLFDDASLEGTFPTESILIDSGERVLWPFLGDTNWSLLDPGTYEPVDDTHGANAGTINSGVFSGSGVMAVDFQTDMAPAPPPGITAILHIHFDWTVAPVSSLP